MIHILLCHWATYVYLAQLLVLIIAIVRSGFGHNACPEFMPISWERIAAHFAWPLRPLYPPMPTECPEAYRITCGERGGASDHVVRLDSGHPA